MNRWLDRQNKDPYTKQAKQQGYRSRAVYKLLEIQEKERILYKGAIVVDLGAAPGGWSQLAVKYVGKEGKVFALDILPIEPIANVDIIEGDFTKEETINQLLKTLNGKLVDIIICDIAPNFSGIKEVDHLRTIHLAELVLDFAKNTLKAEGNMLIKLFNGSAFNEYINELKKHFVSVSIKKPKASRSESSEVYVLAKKIK